MVRCSSEYCQRGSPHQMRLVYSKCNCNKDSCQFKLKIIKCDIQEEFYIYKKSTHKGKLLKVRMTTGIHCAFKKFIINLIKYDNHITPKSIHRRKILQPELGHLKKPKLRQIQNMVNNYRINSGTSNSISAVIDIMKQFHFKKDLDDNRPFFFNVKFDEKGSVILGNGADDNHLKICISSKRLLYYLDSDLPGFYHIDTTYKLIRNKFPLIVIGRTDMEQKFHLIALCITSHEQERDFRSFYRGLIDVADLVEVPFDPDYIVQDGCLASFNAATKLFQNVSILMCYFHVIYNCKKNKILSIVP